MTLLRLLAVAAALAWLGGCAASRPPAQVAAAAPPRWYAPLPHGGSVADLQQWWEQFHDPLLVDLVAAAQAASPDVATAAGRIAEARANRVAARAAGLPTVDANVSAIRGNAQTGIPLSTIVQSTVQTAWEADLFGAVGARLEAATARLAGAQAGGHEARVAVAADTATTYLDLRTCQLQLQVTSNDAESRAETARLSELSANAGFTAPAVAAQARASAADGAVRVTQQRTQCELLVKALVALTAVLEPDLRARLGTPWREPTDIAAFAPPPLPALPAALIAQRPDVYQAEQEV